MTQVKVGGGCRYPWSGSYVSPCTSSHKVYRTVFSSTVPDLTKPAIDLPTWYANAKPGPMSPTCTTGSFPGQFDNDTALNRSNPMQNLFPGSAYDCQVKDGSGNRPRPHRLHAGEPRAPSSSKVSSSSTASSSSPGNKTSSIRAAARSTRPTDHDPQPRALLRNRRRAPRRGTRTRICSCLVSGATAAIGFPIENNTTLQGAIYVVNDFSQGNSVIVCGPVIAQELFISNNTDNCFVPFGDRRSGDARRGRRRRSTLVNVPDSYATD